MVIAATGVVFGLLSLVFMSLNFARFSSAMVWQDAMGNPDDYVMYDVSCNPFALMAILTAALSGLGNLGNLGSLRRELSESLLWTDQEEANRIGLRLAEDCDFDCV